MTFHAQRRAGGKAPRKSGICFYRIFGKTFLWTRKLKKNEGIEEKYITTFKTLKSWFISQRKKTILKIEFQKINLISIFAIYQI